MSGVACFCARPIVCHTRLMVNMNYDFACADVAVVILNYRRFMDAFYDTYTSPEPVDEFMCDMKVRAWIPIFKELLSRSGSEPLDV